MAETSSAYPPGYRGPLPGSSGTSGVSGFARYSPPEKVFSSFVPESHHLIEDSCKIARLLEKGGRWDDMLHLAHQYDELIAQAREIDRRVRLENTTELSRLY